MRAVLVVLISAGGTQLGSMATTDQDRPIPAGRQQKGDPYPTVGLTVTVGIGSR